VARKGAFHEFILLSEAPRRNSVDGLEDVKKFGKGKSFNAMMIAWEDGIA
jgi:hypothetical protein